MERAEKRGERTDNLLSEAWLPQEASKGKWNYLASTTLLENNKHPGHEPDKPRSVHPTPVPDEFTPRGHIHPIIAKLAIHLALQPLDLARWEQLQDGGG